MKIPASIRNLFDMNFERYSRLQPQVDALLHSHVQKTWHYESRLKAIESFTQKVETGRVKNPAEPEDFFAATIVVRTSTEALQLEQVLTSLFDLAFRKPKTDTETHKQPETFPFDDLRLYLRWKDDPALRPTGLSGLLFEVQIKTYLQHAWGIATHDLTYKTDDVNWGKMRIAYQIKAMFEHAEVSIQEAVTLAASPVLAKSDPFTTSLAQFIRVITDLWNREDLPADIRRLGENIMDLADLVNLDAPALRQLLEAESAAGRGPKMLNLSPYGAVLQSLIDQRQADFIKGLERRAKQSRFRPVVVTKELSIPDTVKTWAWRKTTLIVV